MGYKPTHSATQSALDILVVYRLFGVKSMPGSLYEDKRRMKKDKNKKNKKISRSMCGFDFFLFFMFSVYFFCD